MAEIPTPEQHSVSFGNALRRHAISAITFIGANTMDLVTTNVALQKGFGEGNPFMHSLLEQQGFPSLVITKCLIMAIVFAGVALLEKNDSRRASVVAMNTANTFVLTAAALNLFQLAIA